MQPRKSRNSELLIALICGAKVKTNLLSILQVIEAADGNVEQTMMFFSCGPIKLSNSPLAIQLPSQVMERISTTEHTSSVGPTGMEKSTIRTKRVPISITTIETQAEHTPGV